MRSIDKKIEERILDLVKEIELLCDENQQLKLQNSELLQALKKYKTCANENGCEINTR